MKKISAHMICYNCEHRFDVEDYLDYRMHDNKCPKCSGEHIFDESGFGWAYVHLAKHPEQYHPSLVGQKCVEYCDWPRCEEPGCIRSNKKQTENENNKKEEASSKG